MRESLRAKLFCALLGLVASAASHSQSLPSKPLRVILSDGAGGPLDRLTRALGVRLSEKLRQPVIVENRPGAAGMIGMEACSKAPNDGHTFCGFAVAQLSVTPNLQKVAVDPLRDITPVSPLARSTGVIYVNPKLAVGDIKELLALAKARPGALTYASFGNGTIPHILMEWIKRETGTNLLHVPFRDAPSAMNAVIGGTVDVGYFALGSALPQIKARRVKPLAVIASGRTASLPEVPTLKESGLNFFLETWFGLFAPKDTPATLREALAAEVAQVLAEPEFKGTQVDAQAMEVFTLAPTDFAAFLKNEKDKVSRFIQATGISAD
jgi:tripartite-type tricarboxylate transporter receptor subunit TctC